MGVIEPRVFKGTRDFLPEEMIHRDRIIDVMKSTFETYGFEPLETPALEYWDILTGKYGEEGEKLIYRLDYKGGHEVALRYDLTVPLSRVIALYPHLPKPFKRYQMQPVWRADKPQLRQGRFREFYQCDVDTVGSGSMLADAEIIIVTHAILSSLGFQTFRIRINNRKVLAGIVEYTCGDQSRSADICRCIDKLDKIGMDGVKHELERCDIPDGSAQKVLKILEISGNNETVLRDLERELSVSQMGLAGLSELKEVFAFLQNNGLPQDRYTFDLHLARGLDYYTGPIFETVLTDQPHIGSLAGGGRYDELIGLFSGIDEPATGTTIGLDRIYTAMQQLNMLENVKTKTQVLVTLFDDTTFKQSMSVAQELRDNGINTDTYFEQHSMKKQFTYAHKKGIPYVVILGPDECAKDEISVKDMESGEQKTISRNALIIYLQELTG
ncbi:MAG: histidine--tRNA ligase [Gemmatimonadota bacterium]|nr:MAG: histidine--tRNA ligase [Gemmatimonadota bacterium]